jgi:hypothetical protein
VPRSHAKKEVGRRKNFDALPGGGREVLQGPGINAFIAP